MKLVKELKVQPEAFWRYTNSRTKAKAGIDALKNEEGVLVSDSKGKADILNGFLVVSLLERILVLSQCQRCNAMLRKYQKWW